MPAGLSFLYKTYLLLLLVILFTSPDVVWSSHKQPVTILNYFRFTIYFVEADLGIVQ